MATPGGNVYDRNTTSNNVIAVIAGQRLMIAGNADGHVYAMKVRTGELVWSFELSKRGINSSPIVIGETVIIGHSEENVDEATLGRIVALDANGKEIWRNPIKMGFPSPLYHDGVLYAMDNSANFFALNPDTGAELWQSSVGTVGKSAPVWADGKLYVTEVNGNFHILKASAAGVETLDHDELTVESGRYAETYGSPAIAYGRIYFTTEEGLYALGDKSKPFEVSSTPAVSMGEEARGSDNAMVLQVIPADTTLTAGESVTYRLRAFNEVGREVAVPAGATFSHEGLEGSLDGMKFTPAGVNQAGVVVAKAGGLEAKARLRSFAALPLVENFDEITGKGHPWWIGAGRYQVIEKDGNKVLEKPVAPRGLLRSNLFIGYPRLSNYTIQADVMGGLKGRRRTDVGMLNQGYFLDMLGNSQKLEIRTWSAVKRMAVTIPYEWEMDTWYVMKLRVERAGDAKKVLGKVWKKGEAEPSEWTIEASDPIPNAYGAPGLQGYSPAPLFFDNVSVTPN